MADLSNSDNLKKLADAQEKDEILEPVETATKAFHSLTQAINELFCLPMPRSARKALDEIRLSHIVTETSDRIYVTAHPGHSIRDDGRELR